MGSEMCIRDSKKTHHIQAVPKCRKFLKGDCTLKNEKCWYAHDYINVVYEQEKENLGFHKEPTHSQPPDLMQRIMSMMETIASKVDNLEKSSLNYK